MVEKILLQSLKEKHLNQAVMWHVGKAGGGTFNLRSKQWWRVRIETSCHPKPCLHASFDLANHNDTTVFISVRDPVDRFVSAFYWRVKVWCQNGNDTRIAGGPVAQFPNLYCRYFHPLEGEVLFQRYRQNANHLAESLCSNDDDDDYGISNASQHQKNSNETMERAAKDVYRIGHLKASLCDWFGPDWLQKRKTLFPSYWNQAFHSRHKLMTPWSFCSLVRRMLLVILGGIDADPADFKARQDYVHYTCTWIDSLKSSNEQTLSSQRI
jgi:hypothetical protein